MGKPKFSGIGIVDLQNSIGNTTFSRNAYGTYSKTKIGAPASTPFLVSWQAVVSSLRFDWINIMADLDRATWYKLYIPRRQNMGNVEMLNGFDAYLSVNLNRALVSFPPLYTAPVSYNQPANTFITMNSFAGLPQINVTIPAINNNYVVIYLAKQLSAGRMTFSHIYAVMGVLPPFTVTDNFYFSYLARYGGLTAGMKLFAKSIVVNANNGMRSNPLYTSCIIQP